MMQREFYMPPLAPFRHRQPRIALYSHDALGMGHMRRNSLIAQALSAPPVNAVVLLISGAKEMNAIKLAAGVDCITLPALSKGPDGGYQPRNLAISRNRLIELRTRTIAAALDAFEPDMLIVDKIARGVFRELDPSLETMRKRRKACVLGLRDVLDDPATVEREWKEMDNEAAVAEYYSAVWVYGDPTVYDLLREYNLSAEVARRVRFTGYLDPSVRQLGQCDESATAALRELPRDRGLVFCEVGGGEDGQRLAGAFAEAEIPSNSTGVVLTGPFMPDPLREKLLEQAERKPNLRVVEFTSEPMNILRRADRVIAMGGYNTVCELLCLEKRALIVPRTTPRTEQLIRAERLRDLGVLDVLDPDSMTPQKLSEWMNREVPVPVGIRELIDFNALERIPHLARALLAAA
jgi:predicted glycosyltransferase